MIRIQYEEKPEMTFEDYTIMIACYKDKVSKRLAKGKKIKTTTKNLQIIFYEGLIILLCAVIVYLLSDKPLQGWDMFFSYGFGVIGLLYMIGAKVTPLWLKKLVEKAKAKSIKADQVFDEAGVHVWENPEKGFDRSWDQFTDCYISKEHIFIFFNQEDYVLTMSNHGDIEERVLAALEMGNRMDIITRFAVEKGRLKAL